MVVFSFVVAVLSTIALAKTESYEDVRCKCVCTVINGTEIHKKTYIANVPPSKDCNEVSLPVSGEVNNSKNELRQQCTCTYQSRNTMTMMVAVLIVIVVVASLVTYMIYLLCVEPVIKGCKKNVASVEDTNDEDNNLHPVVPLGTRASDPITSVATSSNVFNRFGNQQDEWKIRVKEQRKNVYDRHSVLN